MVHQNQKKVMINKINKLINFKKILKLIHKIINKLTNINFKNTKQVILDHQIIKFLKIKNNKHNKIQFFLI